MRCYRWLNDDWHTNRVNFTWIDWHFTLAHTHTHYTLRANTVQFSWYFVQISFLSMVRNHSHKILIKSIHEKKKNIPITIVKSVQSRPLSKWYVQSISRRNVVFLQVWQISVSASFDILSSISITNQIEPLISGNQVILLSLVAYFDWSQQNCLFAG